MLVVPQAVIWLFTAALTGLWKETPPFLLMAVNRRFGQKFFQKLRLGIRSFVIENVLELLFQRGNFRPVILVAHFMRRDRQFIYVKTNCYPAMRVAKLPPAGKVVGFGAKTADTQMASKVAPAGQ